MGLTQNVAKQVAQIMALMVVSLPVMALIGMLDGWNFAFTRRLIAVLVAIIWVPLGVVAVSSGIYMLARRPPDAGLMFYMNVFQRVFCGGIATLGSVLFVYLLLTAM